MTTAGPTMKTCKKCNATKPVEDFYPHKLMKDRRSAQCKECIKARSAAYAAANKERRRIVNRNYSRRPEVKQKRKAYQQTEKGKQVSNATTLAWMRRNPEKLGAQMMVRGALLCGFMQRQPCEICGTTVRVQGHHDDYSKPMEVKWLCHPHHAERHVQLRDEERERQRVKQ